jgi:fucose 4-O-acetylase-like acetyltransferase
VRTIILQEKINWIDNLKTIGILAVILGHIASPLGSFIYSWHMPLFFMLAGFFIKFDLSLKEFIFKDFKRLMIPYFIFAMVGLIMEVLKRVALHRDSLDYIHELKGIFIWMDMSSLINSYAFVLWFLPALFFARVFLVFIHKYITNLFIQFLVIFVLFCSSFYINLPLAMDNAFNAVLFVFIGSKFFSLYQKKKVLYVLPFFTIILYFYFGIPNLDIATKNYENIFVNIFFALGIIYTFIMILQKINISSKLLTIWGGQHYVTIYHASIYK